MWNSLQRFRDKLDGTRRRKRRSEWCWTHEKRKSKSKNYKITHIPGLDCFTMQSSFELYSWFRFGRCNNTYFLIFFIIIITAKEKNMDKWKYISNSLLLLCAEKFANHTILLKIYMYLISTHLKNAKSHYFSRISGLRNYR